MYQSLSLSLSLSIYICKNGLDPDQTRMEFKKGCFVNLKICACDRKYAKCRTKADAHDKMDFQYISISVYIVRTHARIQRGDRGPGPLSNTRSNPLKFSKQPSQHSALGHRRHASETPLKAFHWRADDGPLLVIFGSSPLKKKKKRCQSSDPDQIRMEFRKECFVNSNIWECDRKHTKHQYRRISEADAHEKLFSTHS